MKPEETNWNRRQLVTFWAIVLVALLLPRILLQTALPVYLFSDDSHSYLLSAFHWTQTGDWETSPRRGAIYSLLIAGVLRFLHNLNLIVLIQHVIGAVAVGVGIAAFRRHVPQKLCWPATLVAVAYALAGFPIFYEQTIRSEILLLLFSTCALAGWAGYLWKRSSHLLLLAGLAFGVATLIKNLLLPFPIVAALCLLADRTDKWSDRIRRIILLGLGCALPLLVNGAINRFGPNPPEAAPQSGILLYGRVAQWTVLDSDLHPVLKKLIRTDIEEYRKLPRLNNNIILKRTAVPHLAAAIQADGGSRADLNQVCRDLAIEAIQADPLRWWGQIWGDAVRLHGKMEFPVLTPDQEDIDDALKSTSKIKHQHPMLHQEEVMATLTNFPASKRLAPYDRLVAWAWLFRWQPVLLTSLLLPLLALFDRHGVRRPFWITACAVWFFNVAIICTVARPIPRYLVTCLPIMFATLGAAFLILCAQLARLRPPRHPVASPTTIAFPKL